MAHIRPLLEAVWRRWLDRYNPHLNYSVDEAMVAFRGRLGFRQYMPGKPTKYGIKVWMRADPANGFVNDFQVYTGCTTGQAEGGLASRVVKDLMAPIEGRHHIVNMDNFFTSPALFTDLLEKGVYARGTMRTNRRHYPRDSLNPKCVKDQGDAKVMKKCPLVATALRDKKTIHLLSTADHPAAPAVQVERKRRDGTGNNVSCPIVVRTWMASTTQTSLWVSMPHTGRRRNGGTMCFGFWWTLPWRMPSSCSGNRHTTSVIWRRAGGSHGTNWIAVDKITTFPWLNKMYIYFSS